MLGHDFPALQGFRGGKGILSGWFIAWTIDWRIGLLIGVVFFVTYLITKYVSLGSVLHPEQVSEQFYHDCADAFYATYYGFTPASYE